MTSIPNTIPEYQDKEEVHTTLQKAVQEISQNPGSEREERDIKTNGKVESASRGHSPLGSPVQGRKGFAIQDENGKETSEKAEEEKNGGDKEETDNKSLQDETINGSNSTSNGDRDARALSDTGVSESDVNKIHSDDTDTKFADNKPYASTANQLQSEGKKIKEIMNEFVKFLHNTNAAVKEEFELMYKVSVREFSSRMDRFKAVVETAVMASQMFECLSAEIVPEFKSLKLAMADMGEFIDKKIKEEDLALWLDLPPNAEEESIRLLEERRATEKSSIAKCAEARAAVAKVTITLAEAEKCVAAANADLTVAIADAERSKEDANRAIKAAEEARAAAEEKRRAEEESKRLAEERAKKKAEEEKLKKEEEERNLAKMAAEKGTSLADERQAFAELKAKQEEERKNPLNWPRFIYSVDPGEYDPGVGCVIRAIPGSLERDDITVKRIDSLAEVAVLGENEELISNVVAVEVTGEKQENKFEEPLAIAFPHCAPRGNPSREPVIKTLTKSGKWVELATKDVVFDDIKELKFVEARIADFGTFMVVLRPKRDQLAFTKKGGKFASSTDPRVTLSARPGMFRVTANITLEVHPIDMGFVSDVKTRSPQECSELLSSSPVVRFSISNRKFSKPLTVTLPLPPSTSRPKQRPSTAISRDRAERSDKRPSTAKPAMMFFSSQATKQDEETGVEENLYLLRKDNKDGNWTVVNDVALTHQKNKDIVIFTMPEPFDRFMVISAKTAIPAVQAEKIGAVLESASRQKKVCLVLRQNTDDASDVAMACTLASKSDRLLHKLSEEGYDEGPPPSQPFVVKEGQIMEVRFRGNVQCHEPDENLKFAYNSQMKCQLDFAMEEIDKFAQKSFDCYRGFAQVYTRGLVPVKIQPEEGRGSASKPSGAWEEGDVLLGELLISLPKPDPEPPKPLNTAPVALKSEGAVDDDILKRISEDLGDEWKRLAQCLNIKKMRIQAILRQNHNNDAHHSVHDMLLTWAKRLPRSVNKVEILAAALCAVGRADLAEDLRGKDYDLRQQRAQSAKESHLRRVFVKIAQDVHVAKQWKHLAKQMGLTSEEIDEIETEAESGPDRCLFSLKKWQEKVGNKATTSVLVKHLRICSFRKTADVVQGVS